MQKILEKSCIRQNPVPSNVAELDFWKKEKCISLCGPEHKIDNDVSITFMAYKIIIMTTFCKSIIFITLFLKKKKKKKRTIVFPLPFLNFVNPLIMVNTGTEIKPYQNLKLSYRSQEPNNIGGGCCKREEKFEL